MIQPVTPRDRWIMIVVLTLKFGVIGLAVWTFLALRRS